MTDMHRLSARAPARECADQVLIAPPTSGPLFSVLTPAYNASKYINELLNSVAAQDYARFEHVVIDDGSTDDTADILRVNAVVNPHLRWYSRPNKGQYATQNELLLKAKGDVISIICADDMYATKRALSLVAEQFAASPDLDVVFGRTPRLCPYTFDPDLPRWLARPLVRHTLCIQHCSLFVRREFLERNELYFDISYRMRGDWDWIIRVFDKTDRVKSIPNSLAYWRYHPKQTSVLERTEGTEESRRLCAAYGIDFRLHRFCAFASQAYAQSIHILVLLRLLGLNATIRKLSRSLRSQMYLSAGRPASPPKRTRPSNDPTHE
jgi:glycosyltransferase involved in cell wall biosynthesis